MGMRVPPALELVRTENAIICAHGSKKDLAPIAAITTLVRLKEQAYSDLLSFVLKLRISVRGTRNCEIDL